MDLALGNHEHRKEIEKRIGFRSEIRPCLAEWIRKLNVQYFGHAYFKVKLILLCYKISCEPLCYVATTELQRGKIKVAN